MKDRVGEIWRCFDNVALVFTTEEHVHEVYSLVHESVQLWHESPLLPWERDDRMTRLA